MSNIISFNKELIQQHISQDAEFSLAATKEHPDYLGELVLIQTIKNITPHEWEAWTTYCTEGPEATREYLDGKRGKLKDNSTKASHTILRPLSEHLDLPPTPGHKDIKPLDALLPKEYLETEYVKNGRSVKEIAQEKKVSVPTVYAYLERHDIPRRPRGPRKIKA